MRTNRLVDISPNIKVVACGIIPVASLLVPEFKLTSLWQKQAKCSYFTY